FVAFRFPFRSYSLPWIEAIQTMCPSSDDNDLAEPRVKRINEFRKGFEFGILLAHASDDSNAEDRILLQIMSACSLPRDGCCPTSSQTWRISLTGTPSFRTTPRKTLSRFPGICT